MHMVQRENLIRMPDRAGKIDRLIARLMKCIRSTRLRAIVKGPVQHMHLIETMSLGGRRQLMLVNCCGKNFLVAAHAEVLHSIVPIRSPQRLKKGTGKEEREELV